MLRRHHVVISLLRRGFARTDKQRLNREQRKVQHRRKIPPSTFRSQGQECEDMKGAVLLVHTHVA